MNDTPEITEFTITFMFPSPDIAGVETTRASMVRRGALVHCFDLPDIPFPLSEPRGPGQPSPRPLACRTGWSSLLVMLLFSWVPVVSPPMLLLVGRYIRNPWPELVIGAWDEGPERWKLEKMKHAETHHKANRFPLVFHQWPPKRQSIGHGVTMMSNISSSKDFATMNPGHYAAKKYEETDRKTVPEMILCSWIAPRLFAGLCSFASGLCPCGEL